MNDEVDVVVLVVAFDAVAAAAAAAGAAHDDDGKTPLFNPLVDLKLYCGLDLQATNSNQLIIMAT